MYYYFVYCTNCVNSFNLAVLILFQPMMMMISKLKKGAAQHKLYHYYCVNQGKMESIVPTHRAVAVINRYFYYKMETIATTKEK